MNPIYKTKDLYLAAYLYANTSRFRGVERNGHVCWFLFEGAGLCGSYVEDYRLGTARCNPKEFADAIRNLKDIVFS